MPWFEVINAGTPAGATSNILAGYQYTHYTTPRPFHQELQSAFANFSDPRVFFKLSSSYDAGPLVGVSRAPLPGIFGKQADWFQRLPLPRPCPLPAQEQIQVEITSRSPSNLSATQVMFGSVKYL